MGGRGSKTVKKITSVLTGASDEIPAEELTLARCGASPFVFTRKGSMYLDEDGDLAHEFYEEVQSSTDPDQPKAKLRRTFENLRPQGQVDHEFPRINPNLPVVMCEN